MNRNPELIAPDIENEDDVFVILIYGFAPEFYEHFAFRLDKSYRRRQKDVICPYCGNVFETVDFCIKFEVERFSRKSAQVIHRTKTCRICHRIVGVRFA